MVLNGLNPYDILGIKEGVDFKSVKEAYKHMLLQTHPDKMGNATYFMLVHEAFSEIKESFNLPKSKYISDKKPHYEKNEFDCYQPREFKEKKFSPQSFNDFFNKNQINDMDPYSIKHGYGKSLSKSLNYQEDIDVIKNKKIIKNERRIKKYIEPEPINQIYTGNYAQLGKTQINDYSCNIGTDYIKAYMDPENLNNVKYNNYNNLEHIVRERSTQSFELTQEDIKKIKDNEKKLRQLERLRMRNMKLNDSAINQRFVSLNNTLK